MLAVSFRSDDRKTKVAVQSIGFDFFNEPLFSIIHQQVHVRPVDLLIATSSNAFPGIANIRDIALIPLAVVGEVTSQKAQEIGFSNVVFIAHDVDSLANWLNKKQCSMAYIRGSVISRNLAAYIPNINEYITYHTYYAPDFSENFIKLLSANVSRLLFFSYNTAKTFFTLISRLDFNLNRNTIAAISISQNVDDGLRSLPCKRFVARDKTHDAVMRMLELSRDMR